MGGGGSKELGDCVEMFGFDRIDKMKAELVLCQRHEHHTKKKSLRGAAVAMWQWDYVKTWEKADPLSVEPRSR